MSVEKVMDIKSKVREKTLLHECFSVTENFTRKKLSVAVNPSDRKNWCKMTGQDLSGQGRWY